MYNTNDTDEKCARIAGFFGAYLENGRQNDAEPSAALEDIVMHRIHLEFHGDLMMRVGGYRTKFVQISPDSQGEVMSRYCDK